MGEYMTYPHVNLVFQDRIGYLLRSCVVVCGFKSVAIYGLWESSCFFQCCCYFVWVLSYRCN